MTATGAEAEAVGSLDVAFRHAMQLLQKNPALAAEQALEILKVAPNHPHARLILGAALRIRGNAQSALEVLEPLAREQPQSAPVHLELGMARGQAGHARAAVAALSEALRLKPDSPDSWRVLADQLDLVGDYDAADHARAQYLTTANKDPRLLEAAGALVENKLPYADERLRAHLAVHPNDVAALRMLAEVAARLRRYADAQELLERCLKLAPSFDAARHNYAVVLNRQGKVALALPQIQQLLIKEPGNPGYRNLQAAILANLGDYADSIKVYEAVLKEFPQQPKIWMSYGHSLKTAGRTADSIVAYRRAIAMQPTLGEVYWSLANLKTCRFSVEDIQAMRNALTDNTLDDEDRLHFEFSLGKALEDEGTYEESFSHYARGNAIRRKLIPYDPQDNEKLVSRSKREFTSEFFASRAGAGTPAADPIFIVGLPRAGSTLIEQILASHSLVEGTMELPDLPRIVTEILHRSEPTDGLGFAQLVARLSHKELRELGEHYLKETRVQRKTDKPFFIDKMPNNHLYVGLIHLILPNAKIIDARRHPLGCCFSGFKQHFARGQNFSYDLDDIGRYYRDYVELMAHIDAVLPGRVHRVFYEAMIEDTVAEVHRLIDYCGLSFEDGCLKFYENDRAVRTASSEQVRQPIFRDGMDHWRHFEPWLTPLKEVLGETLRAYPNVPDFA